LRSLFLTVIWRYCILAVQYLEKRISLGKDVRNDWIHRVCFSSHAQSVINTVLDC